MKNILIVAFFLYGASFLCAEENPLWMRYPSISPDGKQIVFSYQGDLYLVATEGGSAKHLTQHEAYEYQPIWSPDGKYIAFASNRYGNFDIFKLEVSTGKTLRLTYHSANDMPFSFHATDGILFASARVDSVTNALFPSSRLSELYMVPENGGRVKQVLTTPAVDAQYNSGGTKIIYHDVKGYENIWRKHHQSSVAADIWVYDNQTREHQKITTFVGEDRNPVWNDEDSFFYLSEKSGSFNVWKWSLKENTNNQLTTFEKHPVRFLTRSVDGLLCFGYDGEIYILQEGQNPIKVKVSISIGEKANNSDVTSVSGSITEITLSPNGKEMAFIHRGEVFVTSIDYSTTKQITNTFEQERSISFSPDGRSLLYASERNNSWNVYQTSLTRSTEKYFYASTVLKEEEILTSQAETFQPRYSPDGKEIAYLEERTTLKVYNIAEKYSRKILDGKYNYSYSDGDQWYEWSPDGKWFIVAFLDNNRWMDDIGIIAADGKSTVINLSQSGYSDFYPKWALGGKMITWFSDRNGMRAHASWGSQSDVYGLFFSQEAYDSFHLSKEEQELFAEEQKDKNKDNKDQDKTKADDKIIKIDWEGLEDRNVRLTMHSSNLSDAVLSTDGKSLYYLAQFEKGYDLWVHRIYDYQTQLLAKLNTGSGSLVLDSTGNTLFVLANGQILKVNVTNGQTSSISYNAEMVINHEKEREYIFEHVWRQVKKKFYVADLHGVDWEFYRTEYKKFLPYINNKFDFAEMLSELLGELNASHTGSGHFSRSPVADNTASLGIFPDNTYSGSGIKIADVINKGPLKKASSTIKAGIIIEKIDGVEIKQHDNYYPLLNRKANSRVLLSLFDANKNKRWEEVVRPINVRDENELIYQRWVKERQALTEKLSKGKLGYVHIRGMNDVSYRVIYSEILGKYNTKKGIVVDTRFNGGGWLHDDLVTLLSGKEYFKFSPRKQENMGGEPIFKWSKPSIVVMGEGNYSDAHLFPLAYKTLKIGKLVGMPVPGTGTAVWWETLLGGDMYFGIPQVGMLDIDGKYLENNQLEPDIKIANDPSEVALGKDQQLERAIEELLKEVD